MPSYHPAMPVPKPSSGEEQDKFISRCISTLTNAGEFDDADQRVAVCHTAWRDAKGSPEPSSKGRKGLMGYFNLFGKSRGDKAASATQYHGEIGARVQKLREEKDMTQEELAERMSSILDPEAGTGTGGIDVSTIGQIETGEIDVPSQPVIAAFAEALDTTVEALEGLLGKDEEPGSGRFSKLRRDLVYSGAFEPRVTKQDNGKFTIHRVPIFMEHDDRGWNCDAKWMKDAVQKQRQNSRKGVLPRLIVGHNDDDDPNEKPVVAFLDNFTHSTSDGTLYADFTNVPGGLIDQFKDNNWPGRSAEVYPEEHEIAAVALLGGTAPFFKLPDLRLNSKRDHAGEPVLYSMEVKPMASPKKNTKYMDEGLRDEIVQIVTDVVKDVVAEELNDFRRSFGAHDDDPTKNPEHNALHDPEEDARRKKKEEEEAKKMSTTKLSQKYAAIQHQNDALTARLIKLEDKNERSGWIAKYAQASIPPGRLDVEDEVKYIMGLPEDAREEYYNRSLRHLEGPSTDLTRLDEATQAAGYTRGSAEEAKAIKAYYQKNRTKYRGDMLQAVQDYRQELATSNGND